MRSSFFKMYVESVEFLLTLWLAEAKQLISYFRTGLNFSPSITFSWHAYWRKKTFIWHNAILRVRWT